MMGAVSETEALKETVYGIAGLPEKDDIAEILIAYPADKVTGECMNTLRELERADLGVRLDIFPQVTPGIGFFTDTIDRATGSHCIPFQSDLGMDIEIISALIAEAKKNTPELCTTSRWLPECKWTGYGTVKRIINKAAQLFLRVLYGGGLTDYTNPVQIIPTEIFREIKWEENNFARFMELQLKPVRLGYKYREIPTNCYERTDGKSNNSIYELINYLFTAIRIRFMKKEAILKK